MKLHIDRRVVARMVLVPALAVTTAACGGGTDTAKVTPSAPTQTTPAPTTPASSKTTQASTTPAPSKATAEFNMQPGETVDVTQYGGTGQVTVNTITNFTPTGTFASIDKPKPGHHYIQVNATVAGKTGSFTYNALYFKARQFDGTESTYDIVLSGDHTLSSGDLKPGGRVRGNLFFQVPIGSHGTIVYQGILSGDLASWRY